jgi:hypothetical protein
VAFVGGLIYAMASAYRRLSTDLGTSRCFNCEYALSGLYPGTRHCPECGIPLTVIDGVLNSMETRRERAKRVLSNILSQAIALTWLIWLFCLMPNWKSRSQAIGGGLSVGILALTLFLCWRRKRLTAQEDRSEATSEITHESN